MKEKFYRYLTSFITDNRKNVIESIIQNRTRYLTVVLEDIYQSQNASAVLRTCDCFGIQDIHIIENQNVYMLNPDVELGSAKWLNINRYNNLEFNTLEAINNLKSAGYRIIATTPHKNDINLSQFDLSKGKAAFFFGTELKGLTKTALDYADEYLKIPLYGFTESLNISVAAAVILHQLTEKLKQTDINWQLTEEEMLDIQIEWVKSSIKKVYLLEKEFFKKELIS